MNSIPHFLPRDEVLAIAGGIHVTTLWRWERDGLFPRRTHLGMNTVKWDSRSVVEWQRDPAAWIESHRA